MPSTPERKGSKREASSPLVAVKGNSRRVSAAGKGPVIGEKKRVKKYHFAPVNNLDPSVKSNGSVLQSISVSQIRNTAVTKDTSSPLKAPFLPKQKKKILTPVKTIENIRPDYKSLEKSEFKPTQEVIWKYSPDRKVNVNEKLASSQDYSDPVSFENAEQTISSTPIIPNRLKSIINFNNMNDKESVDIQSTITTTSMLRNESLEVKSMRGNKADAFRDIEEILCDIEGNVNTKLRISSPPDVPSSPTELEHLTQIETDPSIIVDELVNRLEEKKDLEEIKESKENCNSFDAARQESNIVNIEATDIEDEDLDNEEDDSLIEILTQKSSKISGSYKDDLKEDETECQAKTIIEEEENEDDDSLLDYLDYGEEIITNQPEHNKSSGNAQTLSMDELLASAKTSVKRNGVVRLVIQSLRESTVPNVGKQKILTCVDAEGETSSVIIRHPWVYLEFEAGDIIHIIEGKHSENKRLLSDDKHPKTQLINDNLLILNPDILLSATIVGNSIECLRRAVLQSIVQDSRGEPDISMILGTIIHELVQDALRYKVENNKLSAEYLENTLDLLLEEHSFSILLCNCSITDIKQRIMNEHFENIMKFINNIVQKSNYGKYVSISGTRQKKPISLSNVFDIEENIWSTVYGLKGFIDATVEAHVESDYFVAPLEIKTGKAKSVSHEAQGLIYTLLLTDKYELPVKFYLLLYTRYNDLTSYTRSIATLKHVLMFRNQMSIRLKYRLNEINSKTSFKMTLPPILRGSFCDTCYMKSECMVLNKLLEDGTSTEAGLRDGEYEILTNHLTKNQERYKEFFMKYNDLITKEESSLTCMNKEMFLLDSTTRESISGRCISNLIVAEYPSNKASEGKFLYEFKRSQDAKSSISMLNSHLTNNDLVYISDEKGHFAICDGRVSSISKSSIVISTSKRLLDNNIILNGNQVKGITNVPQKVADNSLSSRNNTMTYRIDKNELQSGLALARANLLNLFLPPVDTTEVIIDEKTGNSRNLKESEGGNARLRSIIVDCKPPSFKKDGEKPIIPYTIEKDLSFNEDQINAIDKVMRAYDYSLILGMPGTGKTTVIAEIIKILVANKKTILLTSYTHSAVDNVLIKMSNTNMNIIRLGSKQRVHPESQKYTLDYDSIDNYEQYLEVINSASVVATTCLGINDVMLTMREKDFDYVILDEASQVSLPVALGPLRFGRKFILVGDHHQLPPLVKNEAARLGGLEVSPFQMLCQKFPESVSSLRYQYRMCEDIVKLSNFLVYENQLMCGTEKVKNQGLEVPNPDNLNLFHIPGKHNWLENVISPQNKVIFLNYDNCKTIVENSDTDNITNEGEVNLAYQCVRAFTNSGISTKNIGVMSLYRGQIRLLKRKFEKERYSKLEILTADQFQGRDKDCIIISLVRRNNELNGGSLLKELRRVNVAMSRAKSKLIIIGSKTTIRSVIELQPFIHLLDSSGWITDLPENCLTCYDFENNSSQSGDSLIETTQRHTGNKNITSESKVLKNKPITKQILTEL
ncbi:hypothetical protein Kpol_1050p80 [Vanderwaltozyma polyspora DSM 70294]|uniref:DNA replication ATP-dependent helicase/nuclease DNA2 n=1 Tax=Vanderwaltozyma polyspora (strain ATCC 22028 / DSM 70294 / BCRC 21397 / CBS 2163 / NBRC 10782 / NRRL Y-8283 / UCD 57-17) TaxID=436907 RepID=A7TEX4_VANPO|nr:uncharacterized protein Kpol_1050p80 [Vanderwaltozyma polyspora DSM 70294]EDO19220.1 hypothetical protein Kpol_1050p80 [Vanderwaltozyma polyspora DSM 70294]